MIQRLRPELEGLISLEGRTEDFYDPNVHTLGYEPEKSGIRKIYANRTLL